MGWFDGFKESWSKWREKRRKKKELVALDHLRRILEKERKRIQPIEGIVADIEVKINSGNFEDAEKQVPELIHLMKEKKILDNAEMIELKKFKRTMFKELRSEMKEMR